LAELWPVAVILAGLYWLVGRRGRAGRVVMLVAGVAMVAGALTGAALRALQLPPGGTQTIAQAPNAATGAAASLTLQGGALRLAALGPSNNLIEATLRNGPGETAQQGYSVSGGGALGRLTLAQSANTLLWPFLLRRGDSALWDVRLAPHVPLA